ncbi:MAG TPA: glutathione S-transferase family protein [Reyranella sp.]|nr:glutathione S-transferase family protein [Reyranella sp.]
MKLYTHPVSTACRPVMQFIADNNIACDMEVVDILKGAHYGPEYSAKNPNRLVPMLEDGDFRLTESAAILRYLAEKVNSPAYPKDLKQRARVNEAMDWFNSNFYKDWGYGLVYPQLFPHHKRPDEKAHAGTISWAQDRCKVWLQVLNDHWLAGGKKYLCGDQITIADYLGSAIMSIGELIHCDLAKYPNVQKWLANVKKQPNYEKVNDAAFNGFAASTKGKAWQTV